MRTKKQCIRSQFYQLWRNRFECRKESRQQRCSYATWHVGQAMPSVHFYWIAQLQIGYSIKTIITCAISIKLIFLYRSLQGLTLDHKIHKVYNIPRTYENVCLSSTNKGNLLLYSPVSLPKYFTISLAKCSITLSFDRVIKLPLKLSYMFRLTHNCNIISSEVTFSQPTLMVA